jgi:hypothetical protein
MARSVRSRGPPVKASTYAESDDSGGDTETEEQEWNEHTANLAGKASSSRLGGRPSSKRPLWTDAGDKEKAVDGYAPNGAGGPSGSGGKGDGERRRRRGSPTTTRWKAETKEEYQVSRPAVDYVRWAHGSGAYGERVGSREAAGSVEFVPAAPIINVPRDVMSPIFREWMKMAADNVSIRFFALWFHSLIYVSLAANQTISFVFDRRSTRVTPGVSPQSILSVTHPCCKTTPATRSTSNELPGRSMGA